MGMLLKVENMLSCVFYSNRFMLEHLTKVSNVQNDFFLFYVDVIHLFFSCTLMRIQL